MAVRMHRIHFIVLLLISGAKGERGFDGTPVSRVVEDRMVSAEMMAKRETVDLMDYLVALEKKATEVCS